MFRSFKGSLLGTVALIAIILGLLQFIGSRVYTRWDATDEKVYSISDGSRKLAKSLKTPIQIKLYSSKTDKDVPPVFKAYAKRVEEVLKIFRAENSSMIAFESINTLPDSDEAEWAKKSGLQPMRLPSGNEYYLGVIFVLGDKEEVLPYLDPRREEFLEYDLAETFLKLQEKSHKKVSIISSFQLQGNPKQESFDPQMEGSWAFVQALARGYDVTVVQESSETLPPDQDVIVVLHPKAMTDALRYEVDQYLMRGGHLFVAVDPFSRVDLALAASSMQAQNNQMPKVASVFAPFLEKWGVAFDTKRMVGDRLLATPISAGGENLSYPFFMNLSVDRENIDRNSPITHQLRQIVFAEGGDLAFDATKAPGVTFTPLLQTTKNAGTVLSELAMYVRPADFIANLKIDDKVHTLAALMAGPFHSGFSEAVKGSATPYQSQAAAGAAIVLIGDADMFHDANSVERMQMGARMVVRPKNDNLAFLLNSVDMLAGGSELMAIRKSGTLARPFTRVQDLQQKAGEKWRSEEENLTKQLAATQSKLAEMQKERADQSRLNLSPAQEQELARFRTEEARITKARREVRKKLREDIENLGHILAVINIITMPLLISVAGILLYRYRSQRKFAEIL